MYTIQNLLKQIQLQIAAVQLAITQYQQKWFKKILGITLSGNSTIINQQQYTYKTLRDTRQREREISDEKQDRDNRTCEIEENVKTNDRDGREIEKQVNRVNVLCTELEQRKSVEIL